MERPKVKPAGQRSYAPAANNSQAQEQAGAPGWLLLLALFLVGINLRPALATVAPLLETIRAETGISLASAGVLSTLPVFCFGLFAPLAPRLARLLPPERVVFWCFVTLLGGITLRSLPGITPLFSGTVIIGAAISLIMTLLPGLIKRSFPGHAANITGFYTTTLTIGAALASGVAIPLKDMAGSWRMAQAVWALPAALVVLAAIIAHSCLTRNGGAPQEALVQKARGLLRNALAWQVALYSGLQSALAYCVFAWLPTMLVDRGVSPAFAGFLLSLSICSQLVTSLTGPWIATRGKDQRVAIIVLLGLTTFGFLGCLYGPLAALWLAAVLLGLGQGGTFSIANALIVLRSPDASVAASLSGMVQCVGYTIAAAAPLGAGLLHAASHGWNGVALAFILVALASATAAAGAGRHRQIALPEQVA
jgi:CP family cyanate transporter-like MFS transporter